MSNKVLVTLLGDEISPRFDLTTEVLTVTVNDDGSVARERTVVLPHASAEDLCTFILSESVEVVICGGIEEEFFQYLTWKKVEVIDSVMGAGAPALDLYCRGRLEPGAILFDRPERRRDVRE